MSIKIATRTVAIADVHGAFHRVKTGERCDTKSDIWEAMTDDQRKTFTDPAPPPPPVDVGDGFVAPSFDAAGSDQPGKNAAVDDVLAWVDASEARASLAYDVEQGRKKPRSTLVEALRAIIDGTQ